jgi:hypothetical protein
MTDEDGSTYHGVTFLDVFYIETTQAMVVCVHYLVHNRCHRADPAGTVASPEALGLDPITGISPDFSAQGSTPFPGSANVHALFHSQYSGCTLSTLECGKHCS